MNRHLSKILLDTNLLLLWLTARTDPRLILEFKRVSVFTYEDIQRLRRIIATFRAHVSTPHVLAEVSNFIRQAPPHWQAALNREFKHYVVQAVEIYEPAAELITVPHFDALGLTDAGIRRLGVEVMILSMDHRLTGLIKANGGSAVNFSDVRRGRKA